MAADDHAEASRRARRTWSGGDWDACAALVAPVGPVVLDRIGVEPGMHLLDVGTGSGGSIAIPAAQRGARVVGSDVTPELFAHGRRRAAAAGVEIEWVEADAMALPFDDASFDRVTSTFGAMFAPDHARAAAELVRVCRPGGRIGMTTWTTDGFAGELFKLTGRYGPASPPGVGVPPQWGQPEYARDMFAAAGVDAQVDRETVDFHFASQPEAVRHYCEDFGPFVALRGAIEPQGTWEPFRADFAELIGRFAQDEPDGTATISSDYLLITAAP